MKSSASMFRALAAVAWADGVMKPAESDALVRAARSAGLSAKEIAAVEQSTRQHVSLEEIGDLGLDQDQAEYLFTLACMVSGIDGDVDAREVAILTQLGKRLGLGEDALERATRVSHAIANAAGIRDDALEALARAYEVGAAAMLP
jgi:tellurite resistance protein